MQNRRLGKPAFVATTMIAALLSLSFANTSHAQAPAEKRMAPASAKSWKASDLVGQSVYTVDDQEKGKIKDLMIGPDGKIAYAAVSFGGFAGIGDKLFAVPMEAIRITWKDGKVDKARVDVTEQSIKQRQGFNEDQWPQQGDRGFLVGQPTTPAVK